MKGKGALWILYGECIREGKIGCVERRGPIASAQMKNNGALEEDRGEKGKMEERSG